ncbi:hypothetical protein [Amycolatopsis saalfeldensis]|uniref:Asp23 family, cell envelope-related function n=1 Tax=Amycolatopsis saalfeldensis TaxID=394193 RepID=A0A1H8YJ32_9PSEU|nr:hypothetical protein [Amycolatopsis saalfeldensis]SEP52165.1 hypothetical protein SAMN04489732_11947 [Amycolatopsis saalfeldensis]
MTTTTARETTDRIVAALEKVDGLRPATPIAPEHSWVPGDWSGTAVDLDPETVQIRLIATRLPLPPLLDAAADAVRAVLDGTEWDSAKLRLVVTDIDGAAF